MFVYVVIPLLRFTFLSTLPRRDQALCEIVSLVALLLDRSGSVAEGVA